MGHMQAYETEVPCKMGCLLIAMGTALQHTKHSVTDIMHHACIAHHFLPAAKCSAQAGAFVSVWPDS